MNLKYQSFSSNNLQSIVSTQCSQQIEENQELNLIDSIYYLVELITCYPNKKNPIEESPFYSDKKPNISLKKYLLRIYERLDVERSCFIVGFIFFQRIIMQNSFKMKKLNFHKLLFISIMIAVKMINGKEICKDIFQKISGISQKEINNLELNFLKKVNFRLFVEQEQFKKHEKLMISIALKLNQNELNNVFDVF